MQITKAKVTPVELKLKQPVHMAAPALTERVLAIDTITAIFVRMETQDGRTAWGCTTAHPQLTGETPEDVIKACQAGAAMAPDLHPMNVEYSLDELASRVNSPAALCAFDLAFHDLLSLSAGMPIRRRSLAGLRAIAASSSSLKLRSMAPDRTIPA